MTVPLEHKPNNPTQAMPTLDSFDTSVVAPISEKSGDDLLSLAHDTTESRNPVLESCEWAYRATDLVHINDEGVKIAAKHIQHKLASEKYTPRTWRTHALHILPSDPAPGNPDPDPEAAALNKTVLDWIFLISALNFSFWSEKEGEAGRFGVLWRTGWDTDTDAGEGEGGEMKVWTGYWSLVAALNRALEEDIPITDPHFYSSETLCPDNLIAHVFRRAEQSTEDIPLFNERVAVMRQVGFILCNGYGGSYKTFLDEFQRRHDGQGTALDLATMVAGTFPAFRDEVYYEGVKVCLWKRAQILVAETWAAFYPPPPPTSSTSPTATATPHPLFPSPHGAKISQLTMFADYRVPQILHHLRILSYPPSLLRLLRARVPLVSGGREEVSLRAASVVAVERVRGEILRGMRESGGGEGGQGEGEGDGGVSSVLIDFYLWDLAKKVESGEERIEGIDTAEMVPIHRTRSIWY